jgi:hypothetical protein
MHCDSTRLHDTQILFTKVWESMQVHKLFAERDTFKFISQKVHICEDVQAKQPYIKVPQLSHWLVFVLSINPPKHLVQIN